MRLHELAPAVGSKKRKKRGHKGQNARSGGGVRPGFEGGQMPLQRRIPKRGFNNIFKKRYAIINVKDLQMFEDGAEINVSKLLDMGIIKKRLSGLKILGEGKIEKKLNITAAKFSKVAVKKIEAAGGKVSVG